MESDPIHGSLGPPPGRKVDPTPEQALEEDLRKYKPREYTHEVETVKDTENSISTAEKLVGSKMAEPYDVEKKKAKDAKNGPPTVRYTIHDSDDEDPDTIETRKSLRTAEHMLGSRFFTNETDRKLYEQREKDGTLRPEVKNFEDKDDNDPVSTQEEVDKKDEERKEKKAEAQKLRELEEEADKAKVKAQKEFLDEKVKKDIKLLKEKEDAKAAASAAPFIPPELQGVKLPK